MTYKKATKHNVYSRMICYNLFHTMWNAHATLYLFAIKPYEFCGKRKKEYFLEHIYKHLPNFILFSELAQEIKQFLFVRETHLFACNIVFNASTDRIECIRFIRIPFTIHKNVVIYVLIHFKIYNLKFNKKSKNLHLN